MNNTDQIAVDSYVFDVLMPDLSGHDRTPAAFLVYLYLWRLTRGDARRSAQASYRTIALDTGLSRTTAQAAVARLKQRRLIAVDSDGPTAVPRYRVLRPWRRS